MHPWSTICASISRATGREFRLAQQAPVGGGSIHEALVLTGSDGRRFFIKLNAGGFEDRFAAEAEGLSALRACTALHVPAPVACGREAGSSWLVLEYIPLRGRPDPARFGTALAALHRISADRYGWHRDNAIGSTPQSNAWSEDWIGFWGEQRLGYQLALARARGAPPALQAAVARVIERLPELLADHRPQPSLLHGDLWSGNWGADAEGRPVIFDPATYFGDREADIAMTRLFGSPGEAFHAAYDAAWPLAPGHRTRRDLYNLYHVLNHYSLFGGGYAEQARAMAQGLLG